MTHTDAFDLVFEQFQPSFSFPSTQGHMGPPNETSNHRCGFLLEVSGSLLNRVFYRA